MIDMNKQYKTRDGKAVRLFCVDGAKSAPIVGMTIDEYGNEANQAWHIDGTSAGTGTSPNRDLIEQVPVVERYAPIVITKNNRNLVEIMSCESVRRAGQASIPNWLELVGHLRIRQPAGNTDPLKIEVAVIPLESPTV
jgi:hypothetical protein